LSRAFAGAVGDDIASRLHPDFSVQSRLFGTLWRALEEKQINLRTTWKRNGWWLRVSGFSV
jgi:hypothetical protein